MKLPEHCEKIRKGQVWIKRSNRNCITITGKAHGKSGLDYWHTAKLFNMKIGHRISAKDIWRYYDFIGYEWIIDKQQLIEEYGLKEQVSPFSQRIVDEVV